MTIPTGSLRLEHLDEWDLLYAAQYVGATAILGAALAPALWNDDPRYAAADDGGRDRPQVHARKA